MVVIELYKHDYDKEANPELDKPTDKSDDPAGNTGNDAVSTTDIIGKTFLMEPRDDGQQFRAKIVAAIKQHEDQQRQHPEHQNFRCSFNHHQYKAIFGYNKILQFIDQDHDDTTV